ncbi:hypothetical protein V5O48_006099 [Marasmius crinis-equi]|uniref:Uncharacterized protein n=1 Tax=Marasmius crinis-equi TaxID=585013 RepID=A0ABR3FKZ2_9AGAR
MFIIPRLAHETNLGHSFMQDHSRRCLRLQGEAERRWLLLRGCPESSLDAVISDRRRLRAHQLMRYEKELYISWELRDKVE